MNTWHDYTTRNTNALMRRTALTALLGILLAALPAVAGREEHKRRGDERKPTCDEIKIIPFTDARLRIEINATDGDSGLHALLDAEGWEFVKIFDPRGKLVFHVAGGGSVKKTGLTELFFESAEPGFEELPLAEFLKRFPAGEYECVGKTINGDILHSIATLTHALPDAPVLLAPAEGSVQNRTNTVVWWAPVADPVGSHIVRYEVLIVEDGTVPKRVLSVVVPATETSMAVPAAFLTPNGSYKWEVLAIEAGGNQTLSEATFLTAP